MRDGKVFRVTFTLTFASWFSVTSPLSATRIFSWSPVPSLVLAGQGLRPVGALQSIRRLKQCQAILEGFILQKIILFIPKIALYSLDFSTLVKGVVRPADSFLVQILLVNTTAYFFSLHSILNFTFISSTSKENVLRKRT